MPIIKNRLLYFKMIPSKIVLSIERVVALCLAKNSLTCIFSHVRITTISLKEAKLAVLNAYTAIVIMQRRLVVDRGDGLLLLYS